MTYECHGLDTQTHVRFYEQNFYILSNFSSFTLIWKDIRFDTLEAAYHWEKFNYQDNQHDGARTGMQRRIQYAPSAHEAFQLGQMLKELRHPHWDVIKLDIMRQLLTAKVDQHEYVKRKLLATGDRILEENSWRDSFYGTGPDGNGENMLGKLWMELRDELRTSA